jgi:hypothetical protein
MYLCLLSFYGLYGRYEILHTFYICALVLLLSESRAIINDQNVILHCFKCYKSYIYDNGYFTFYVDVFFPLSLPILLPDLTVYVSNTAGVLQEAWTTYPYRAHEVTPGFLVGSVWLVFLVFVLSYYVSLGSVLWGSLRFPHNNDVRFVFTSSFLYEGACLIYVFTGFCI